MRKAKGERRNGKGRNLHFSPCLLSLCAGIVLFAVALSLAGCGSVGQLGKFKEQWRKENYTWIAEQEITCKASDEGCNQLHLVKGDACFRLAKQGIDARTHYACAAAHLEVGIQQTTNWKMGDLDLNRAQTYENLCEALRQWQDMVRGDDADRITQRLLKTAPEFLTAEPANLAAIYFLNSARFTTLRRELLHPTDARALCGKLKEILRALDEAMPKAGETRYAPNYQRLRSDVAGAKQTVGGCE